MSKKRSFLSNWRDLISLLVLTAIAIITIFAYFASYYGWKLYLEIFSHFQVQYFLISLFLLIILFVLRCQKQKIYIGIFLCAILSMQILPWFLPTRNLFAANQRADLKILVANVNTQNTSYGKVLDLVKFEKPDLAIFMEVDKKWQDLLEHEAKIMEKLSKEASIHG